MFLKRCWCGWNLQMVLWGNVKLCSPSFLLCWLYWFTFTGRKVPRCQTKLEKWKIRSTETNIFSNFEEKGSKNWYLSDATFSVTFTSPKSVNLKTLNVNMPEKLSIGFVCNSQPEKISFLVAASLVLAPWTWRILWIYEEPIIR